MNLRPAAALALVGWYLMVPPTGRDYSMGNVGVPRTPEDNYWLSPGAADAYARAATRRGDPGARGRQVGEVRRTSRSHLETVFGGGGSSVCVAPKPPVRSRESARPTQNRRHSRLDRSRRWWWCRTPPMGESYPLNRLDQRKASSTKYGSSRFRGSSPLPSHRPPVAAPIGL